MRYDVKIYENKPFIKTIQINGNEVTIRRNSSVEITFYNDDGSIPTKEYGYITMEEISQAVQDEKDIILDQCYVKDLMLSRINMKTLFSSKYTFFDGEASFEGTTFSRNANFMGATFSGEANFMGATFSGEANFGGAGYFFGRTSCVVTFGGKVTFSRAIFSEKTCFHGAIFSEDVNFNEVIFSGGVFFFGVTFSKEIQFVKTTFNKKAYFDGVTAGEQLLFHDNIVSTHINMRLKKCNLLSITDCIIEKTMDLGDAKINLLCLINTKNLGQIFLDWENNNIKKSIYDYAKKCELSNYEIGKQFLLLKENFNIIGQYDDEDKAYVEYKRCIRRSKRKNEQGIKKRNIVMRLFNWLLDWIIDIISNYCTNPKRIVTIIPCVVVMFAFLNTLPWSKLDYSELNGEYLHTNYLITVIRGKVSFEHYLQLRELFYSLYHSFITFFTIGYGDITPLSLLSYILSYVEGFFGVLLMSLFTVTVVRKILR